jgi:hypothetical protein
LDHSERDDHLGESCDEDGGEAPHEEDHRPRESDRPVGVPLQEVVGGESRHVEASVEDAVGEGGAGGFVADAGQELSEDQAEAGHGDERDVLEEDSKGREDRRRADAPNLRT